MLALIVHTKRKLFCSRKHFMDYTISRSLYSASYYPKPSALFQLLLIMIWGDAYQIIASISFQARLHPHPPPT